MRWVLVTVLIAVPVALATWVVVRGVTGTPPGGELPLPAAARDPDAVLAGVFAKPLAGAHTTGDPETFDGDGLFEHINGAAPTYIERGFRKVVSAELALEAGGELSCDVYDMTTADGAAAIFDHEQPPSEGPPALGDGARVSKGSVVFRRGRYYVKIVAFDQDAGRALLALARAIDEELK